jgi:hypothetical protein
MPKVINLTDGYTIICQLRFSVKIFPLGPLNLDGKLIYYLYGLAISQKN